MAITEKELNKKFTELVSRYLAKGYYINTTTMGGTQGERGRVDLTNDKEVIRVLLDQRYANLSTYVVLSVLRCPENIQPNKRGTGVIWNDKLEVIENHTWYLLGTNHSGDDAWGNYEEAQAAQQKHLDRYKDRCKEWHNVIVINTLVSPKAIAASVLAANKIGQTINRRKLKTSDVTKVYSCIVYKQWKEEFYKEYRLVLKNNPNIIRIGLQSHDTGRVL